MTSEEIRKNFLDFFKSKGHVVVPSSSLIPDDPSVLLTTAGMQQFKPYFTGELDPERDFGARRTASIQKSFRTSDIEEVGDKTHLTFFEMLGNFSFGFQPGGRRPEGDSKDGYFKREAISWAYEYVTEVLGISPERITATVFAGDGDVPYDRESYDIWHKEIGLAPEKIAKRDRKENFWGPTGNEGPCGPTTEIYVDNVEIWNLVFNQYYQHPSTSSGQVVKLEPLKSFGVDTGLGFERLVSVLQGVDDIFETDIFHPLMSWLNELAPTLDRKYKRILADHLRASVFLIADGVCPSNKEAGYILRRLLRRILAYAITHDVHGDLFEGGYRLTKEKFGPFYPELKDPRILEVMQSEKDKFEEVVANGLREIKKHPVIDAKTAFMIHSSYGFAFELIKEMAPPAAVKDLHYHDFEKEFKKHQEISRAGVEKKFGGHGLILDTGELKAGNEEELKKVLRLHTATHLLQAALRQVLGAGVRQMGSDVTAERTRFDFTFDRKMTREEIKKVEEIVNDIVKQDLPVAFREMPKSEAQKTGALYFFKGKYPEKVKVYYVGHRLEEAVSKEFCGGPHVDQTGEIGKFRIAKEEAVSAGVRRIRGVVE